MSTISVDDNQKALVKRAQKVIKAEVGIEPDQGEAVAYACREYIEAHGADAEAEA